MSFLPSLGVSDHPGQKRTVLPPIGEAPANPTNLVPLKDGEKAPSPNSSPPRKQVNGYFQNDQRSSQVSSAQGRHRPSAAQQTVSRASQGGKMASDADGSGFRPASTPLSEMRHSPSDSDSMTSDRHYSMSRHGSRMIGNGTRLNLNIPDKAKPTLRNTYYFVNRKPPIAVDAVKYMGEVSKAMVFSTKEHYMVDSFRKRVVEKDTQDIFVHSFWLIFCLIFQTHNQKQLDTLVTKLSRKHISHFMTVIHRDFYMKYFPYLLAHAIGNCLWDTFVSDRNVLTLELRRDILHILVQLQTGIKMLDSLFTTTEERLFPAGIASLFLKVEKQSTVELLSADKNQSESNKSTELMWIQEYLSRPEFHTVTENVASSEAKKKAAKNQILDEASAGQHLLVDVNEVSDEYRLPKMRIDPIPPQVTDYHQNSPLVQGYFAGGSVISAEHFLESIQDIVDRRKLLIHEARRQAQPPSQTEKIDMLKLECERYARKREQTFNHIHNSYVRKKENLVVDTEVIHEKLELECKAVESMKEQVMKDGDVAITQLTMKILANQEMEKEMIRRNLVKLGYSDTTAEAKQRILAQVAGKPKEAPRPSRRRASPG